MSSLQGSLVKSYWRLKCCIVTVSDEGSGEGSFRSDIVAKQKCSLFKVLIKRNKLNKIQGIGL